MFLEILLPNALATSTENISDNQLLIVILESLVAMFAMFKIAKFLSKIKTLKKQVIHLKD